MASLLAEQLSQPAQATAHTPQRNPATTCATQMPVNTAEQLAPATVAQPDTVRAGKRLVRIIRYLRDDIEANNPRIPLPSSWMIRCLVESSLRDALPADINERGWHTSVVAIMRRLQWLTSSSCLIRENFFELDGTTPLFPNRELFAPQHVSAFATAVLEHLRQHES